MVDPVTLWDVTDRNEGRPIGEPLSDHTGAVYAVAFAPDGRTLAAASADGTVTLWDIKDPASTRRIGPPLTGHTDGVYSVAFALEGRTLATAGADGTVIRGI